MTKEFKIHAYVSTHFASLQKTSAPKEQANDAKPRPAFRVGYKALNDLATALNAEKLTADDFEKVKAPFETLVKSTWEDLYGDNADTEGNDSRRVQAKPPIWEVPNSDFWYVHPRVVIDGKQYETYAVNPPKHGFLYVINIYVQSNGQ